MRFVRALRPRRPRLDRKAAKDDTVAGVVLGVESVPDGLAAGLLAGVNPLAGLYAYLFGMAGGALLTSTPLLTVQATGAMSLIVSDAELGSRPDPERALFTLAMLTGVVMIVAGVVRAGWLLRFVPTAVMVGFISAVGVNIILGQLDNLTGYDSNGANRILRALDLLLHFWQVDLATISVGIVTIVVIVVLERTPVGAMGLVVAIAVGSVMAYFMDAGVPIIKDISDVPSALPKPVLPVLSDIPVLVVPAISLAFVGLVQGAGVSAHVSGQQGERPDPSRDFIGAGVGNIASGIFRGMPAGGSMSASVLAVAAGARSRMALFIAAGIMALVVVLFAGLVGYVAMPALAGLLIVIGVSTVKPDQIISVAKTSRLQMVVMGVTASLTLLFPVQYAVLAGVAIAIILYVVQQSNSLRMKRLMFEEDGTGVRETEPPSEVPASTVVVLQPYGSLFFASTPVFEAQLPTVTPGSTNSVVVLRLRGVENLGLSQVEVLRRYALALDQVGSRLVLVPTGGHLHHELRRAGMMDLLGEENVYRGNEWLGRTVRRAYEDSLKWVRERAPKEPPPA